jgi:hypothetical protein
MECSKSYTTYQLSRKAQLLNERARWRYYFFSYFLVVVFTRKVIRGTSRFKMAGTKKNVFTLKFLAISTKIGLIYISLWKMIEILFV